MIEATSIKYFDLYPNVTREENEKELANLQNNDWVIVSIVPTPRGNGIWVVLNKVDRSRKIRFGDPLEMG